MLVLRLSTIGAATYSGCPGTACSEMTRKSRITKHVGFLGMQDIEFWRPGRQNSAGATLVGHWGSHGS